jgi:hypothetical protein
MITFMMFIIVSLFSDIILFFIAVVFGRREIRVPTVVVDVTGIVITVFCREKRQEIQAINCVRREDSVAKK